MSSEPLSQVYAALHRQDWDTARALCCTRLAEHPDHAAAHHAIGLSFCGEHAYLEGLPHLERAMRADRDTPRWRRDLGAVYAHLGRWFDALEVLAPIAATLDPQALTLLLTAGLETNRAPVVLSALRAREEPLPDDLQLQCAYGRVLVSAGRLDAGTTVLQECLARQPQLANAYDGLATVAHARDHGDLALAHWREAVRLNPRSAAQRLRLALACSDQGLTEDGRRIRAEADALGFTRHEHHATALYMMLSDPWENAASILAASRRPYETTAVSSAPVPATPRRARAGRRLRVGYLSGEFRSTPAFYFFAPFLTEHDRDAFEVFLYNASAMRDTMTETYIPLGEHWREVAHLTDEALRDQLRRDELDVIVDLSGYFPYNRLAVLAHRLAPVQATYPNYPSTTGCPGVDYFVTDPWTSPPGTDAQYSERLHHIPSGYLVFAPPADAPALPPLPCAERGYVTFGLFQRLAKLNPVVWDAVAQVLARVPDSRLLLQNGDGELDRPGSLTVRRLRAGLADRGIDPDRMTLQGPLSRVAHLKVVSEVDISLDTFPYTGQTTTCESLWMGVPVVTLRHDTHVGRVCAALVTRVGHPEWVANSADAFVHIAERLASDVDALARVRVRLRDDCLDAGLPDGRRLARALESAYRSWL